MYRTITCIALFTTGALAAEAQEAPVVITIETENAVLYRGNTFDINRIAKDQTPTASVNTAFLTSVNVADIVALNGKPARGIWSYQVLAMPFRANPVSGQAIADMDGSGIFQCIWHVLTADGTYLGTIQDSGAQPGREHVIIGGIGAFFGATGVHETMESVTPQRGASTSEDPMNRRIHGGGKVRVEFRIFPRSRPQVELTSAGPSVYHGTDSTPVTTARPARPGELLIARAMGLGPTRPNLDSVRVKPFSTNPLEVVNAPVEVSIDGKQAEVINAIGWPEETTVYRVDFHVPGDARTGSAAVRLTSAGIQGPEVTIPIR